MPKSASHFTVDQIDEKSGRPLNQQIYELLKSKIVDGSIAFNELLPAEQELTKMLGVSRITVKYAVNELAVAGLVRRQRGVGTVVIYDAVAPAVQGRFETMIDGLTKIGVETKVKLLDCTLGAASPAIAQKLELEVGTSVQRIVRLRTLNDEPFSFLITYIPYDIAEKYDEALLASESLIKLLEMAGHPPVEAEQTITATAAEPAVAANLGVAARSPLLKIHRIMRNSEHRPVQDITAHYRPDRFEYHMHLQKENGRLTGWKTKE